MLNPRAIKNQEKLKETREEKILTKVKRTKKIDEIKNRKKLIMEGTKEVVGERIEIIKINAIKIRQIEIKSKLVEATERMNENSGEFEMKMLKNEI